MIGGTPRFCIDGNQTRHRVVSVRRPQPQRWRPRRTAPGFDGRGFGIEVGGKVEQHSRKVEIISKSSHFSRARGSLSEMGSVQNRLLLRMQNRDDLKAKPITRRRAERF